MAAKRLTKPDQTLATDSTIPVVRMTIPELVRISGHQTGEPFFGASGGNRFDAPGWRTSSPEYQCCYLGLSFDVALAESLLHDAAPVRGAFSIAQSEIDRRWVHRFTGTLNLMDLTGPLLKRMGGHAGLTGSGDYKLTQKWALAVFSNPQQVDGFLYMSRHLPTQQAVVLFDRAKAKLAALGHEIKLSNAPEMPAAMATFHIKSI